MRFKLRSFLILTGILAVVVAGVVWKAREHSELARREAEAINETLLDIYGDESECSIPSCLVPWVPRDLADDLTHIVEIHLIFNELSDCDPREMRKLSRCQFVHTLYIHNPTLSAEMRDAILSFPNLKTLATKDWFMPIESHECDLHKDLLPGINVIFE